MNPLDLFVLGICVGAGQPDWHSGRFHFGSSADLRGALNAVGLMPWWQDVYVPGVTKTPEQHREGDAE